MFGYRTFINEEYFRFFTPSFRYNQTITEQRKELRLYVMSISIVKMNI